MAGLCGGFGVTPGGNVGLNVAVFEQGARHVAKGLGGKNVANPTATLLSTSMMLRYLSLHDAATRLEAAVMAVYASPDKSALTPDVGGSGNLASFTDAIIKQLKA